MYEENQERDREKRNERGKCVQCTQLGAVDSATFLSLSLSPAQQWAWHGHIAQIELSMELLPTLHDSWHRREAKRFAYNSQVFVVVAEVVGAASRSGKYLGVT